MLRVSLGSLLILSCSLVLADGIDAYDAVPEADYQWYAKAYKSKLNTAKAAVETAEKERRRHRAGKKRQEAERAIEVAKQRVATLEKNDPPYVPAFAADTLKGGRFGRLVTTGKGAAGLQTLRVDQVIGEGEVLVTPSFGFALSANRDGVNYGSKEAGPWLLSGIDTSNVTDGTSIEVDDVFYCKGTETYDTADGGTNTVFSLRRVDPEDVLKPVEEEEDDAVE